MNFVHVEEIVIDQPEITCANLNAKIHFETYEDYERVDCFALKKQNPFYLPLQKSPAKQIAGDFSLEMGWSRPGSELRNAPERFLRLMVDIEKQRPVFPSAYGEIIEPGVVVRDAPEGDALDDAFVFAQHREEFFVE